MTEPQTDRHMTKRGFWSWTLGIPAALAGILSALNIIFDVQVRPTWSWEHNLIKEEIVEIREEIDKIKIIQLNTEIYQIEMIISNYKDRDKKVPRYLTDRLHKLEDTLEDLK